ncbi:MAG: flagellar hook-length control protein FliK [Bdellovibrionales bacterium]
MSSLRLTNSLSSSLPAASATVASGAGAASNELTDTASLFSSLLDQLRNGASGGATNQGGTSSLSGVLADSRTLTGSSLAELGSSWKSYLNTWSNKLPSYGANSSTLPVARAIPSAPKAAPTSTVSHDHDHVTSCAAPSGYIRANASDPNTAVSADSNGLNRTGDSRSAAESAPAEVTEVKDDNGTTDKTCDDTEVTESTTYDQTGDSGAQTLGGLFAELQALMEQLRQRLQAMNGECGSRTCADSTDPDAASDDQSSEADAFAARLASEVAIGNGEDELQDASVIAATQGSSALAADAEVSDQTTNDDHGAQNMLRDLLALAHTLDDRLGLSRDEGAVSAATSTPFEELGHQLKTDLKSITESLKAVLASAQNEQAVSANGQTTDITTTPDASFGEPSAELVAKAFTTAEHMVAQLASLSNAAGDAMQPQGRLASAPAFGTDDAMHALFGSSGAGGTADSGSLDSGSFRQQGGASSGSSASAGNTALTAGLEGVKGTNPYSFANQLASLRSASSGLTTLSSPAEQIIVHLHRTLANGDNRLSIQLNPTELGRIDIRIDMTNDGKAHGTVVASNPSTLEMLQKDSRGLERALQEAGLRADPGSLSFSLGGQQGQSFDQTAQNGGFGSAGGSRDGSSSLDSGANTASLSGDSLETWVISPNHVNVKI